MFSAINISKPSNERQTVVDILVINLDGNLLRFVLENFNHVFNHSFAAELNPFVVE